MNVNHRNWVSLIGAVLLVGCNSTPQSVSTNSNTTAGVTPAPANATSSGQTPFNMSGATKLPGGLLIKDTDQPKPGTENKKHLIAEDGDTAEMEYTGELANGSVFDSNMPDKINGATKPPFSFPVGEGQVIKGWDEGIVGLHVGQTRLLEIPSTLGYGVAGSPPKIPGNATLFFTVKLLGLVKQGQGTVFDTKDVKIGTGAVAAKGDMVTISMTGELLNGLVFGTVTKDKPLRFQVITGAIDAKHHIGVTGLAYAVKGMKVGGERIMIIPPADGFVPGAAPQSVPPGSILKLDVTLLKVEPPSALGKK